MVNDPRDARAYQIGIAFLGLAVVAVIAGVGWVAVEELSVRSELWIGAAAIVGVLVGILIPLPFAGVAASCRKLWVEPLVVGFISLVVLMMAGGAGAIAASEAHPGSYNWCGFWAAIGGVLLGVSIPSPGRRDG